MDMADDIMWPRQGRGFQSRFRAMGEKAPRLIAGSVQGIGAGCGEKIDIVSQIAPVRGDRIGARRTLGRDRVKKALDETGGRGGHCLFSSLEAGTVCVISRGWTCT